MVYDEILAGRYVTLHSISEADAQFSLDIRQIPEKNTFLHTVDNDLEKQKRWIEQQRGKEGDYFFVAETLAGEKVGTVGVYDIHENKGHLGRLLFIKNPFQTFEGTILAMRFAYDVLGLDSLMGDVHEKNQASMDISEAVGFHFQEPVYDPELDRMVRYGTSYREEFPTYRKKIESLIYRD